MWWLRRLLCGHRWVRGPAFVRGRLIGHPMARTYDIYGHYQVDVVCRRCGKALLIREEHLPLWSIDGAAPGASPR